MTVQEIESEVDLKWLTTLPSDESAVERFIESVDSTKFAIWFFQSLDETVHENFLPDWERNWEVIITGVNTLLPVLDLPTAIDKDLRGFLRNLSIGVTTTNPSVRTHRLIALSSYWKEYLRKDMIWRCHVLAENQSQ